MILTSKAPSEARLQGIPALARQAAAVFVAIALALPALAFEGMAITAARAAGSGPRPVAVWMTPGEARIEVYEVMDRLLYQVVSADGITTTGEFSRTRLRDSLKLRSLSGSGLNLEIGPQGELLSLHGQTLDTPQPPVSLNANALLGRLAAGGLARPGPQSQTSVDTGNAKPPPPVRGQAAGTARVTETVVKTHTRSVWDRQGVDLPEKTYVERAAAAATKVRPARPESRPPLLVEKQFMADTIGGSAIPATRQPEPDEIEQRQAEQAEPRQTRTTRRAPAASRRSQPPRKRAMTAADHIISGLRR